MRVGELVFGRKRFQPLFHRLHGLALDGLNYDCASPERNGEYALLDRLASKWSSPVVFDVGGFEGEWSAAVLSRVADARVYTFEPNPASNERIRRRLGTAVSLHQLAFGAEPGTGRLFAPPEHPDMASLHARDLRHVGESVSPLDTVTVTTIDAFCAEHDIAHIDLLKLDVEGHEFAALQGAREMLVRRAIAGIQFEFGGTALDARVFLRDILDVLEGYRVYRILRDGLDPVRYHERAEILTFSNFFARLPEAER